MTTTTRKTARHSEQQATRAAEYYLAGRKLADRMEFDAAWKCFEASMALYRKAGRAEDARYIEDRCREDGYIR